MKKQKAITLYPHTYTGNSFKELQDALSEGWILIQTILSYEDKNGGKIYYCILEPPNVSGC